NSQPRYARTEGRLLQNSGVPLLTGEAINAFGARPSPQDHLKLRRITLDFAVECGLRLRLDRRLERQPERVLVEPAERVRQRVPADADGPLSLNRHPGIAQHDGQVFDRPLPALPRLNGDLPALGIDCNDGVCRLAGTGGDLKGLARKTFSWRNAV